MPCYVEHDTQVLLVGMQCVLVLAASGVIVEVAIHDRISALRKSAERRHSARPVVYGAERLVDRLELRSHNLALLGLVRQRATARPV